MTNGTVMLFACVGLCVGGAMWPHNEIMWYGMGVIISCILFRFMPSGEKF